MRGVGIRLTFLLSLLFGVCLQRLPAQIAPGQWRTHFSYATTTLVAWAGQNIFAGADGKLFSYNPQSDELRQYNLLTGLHGNLVSMLHWNAPTRTLLVVYSDGNFDFIRDETITNLPDYRKKTLTGSKTIRGCRMYGKHAYLPTECCLLDIDMERQEIADTYFFRMQADELTAFQDFAPVKDQYFLLTADHRIFHGSTADNLLDRQNWEELPFVSWLTPQQLVSWNDSLYVSSGRFIARRIPSGGWEMYASLDEGITSLNVEEGMLVIGFSSGKYEIRTASGQIRTLEATSSPISAVDLSFKANGEALCTASEADGIALWSLMENGIYRNTDRGILPNGPTGNTAWKMYFHQGNLYTVSGGRWGNRYFFTGGINCFSDNGWSSPIPSAEEISETTGIAFRDIVSLAIDPTRPDHIFAGSWGDGVYEFDGGALKTLYNHTNSPLITMFPANADSYNYVRADGLTYDREGNLWMTNSDGVTGRAGIHLLRPDGSWYSPKYSNFPTGSPTLDDILFTSRGHIWINSERYNSGLFVIDPNGTFDDAGDDRTQWIDRFYDQDGKTVDLFTVHCLVEDKDGTLWIGTTYGPLLYYHSSSLFDRIPTFTRIKVPRNDGTNEADYLLSTSRIQAIAVDGANRKWMGTDNDGVFLISPDGMTTIHHFTTENSPLPSDNVFSIAIHPDDGEVFIGTENGLVSYRDLAIEGKENYSRVYAFPNPVRPEFAGDITVTGLTENSQIHITDIHGHLMAKGTSLGGQFAWNGCTPSGERAASGVYLVFAAGSEGNKGVVCKIVLIK